MHQGFAISFLKNCVLVVRFVGTVGVLVSHHVIKNHEIGSASQRAQNVVWRVLALHWIPADILLGTITKF